jgi:GNAT superfamily N-acetyltransferase
VGCGEESMIIGAMVMQGNEVRYLVVSPGHRRKGVARMLVKKAKAVCKEYGVRAKVSPKNTSVIRLLTAEDFHRDGTLEVPGSIIESWICYSWTPP